MNSTEEQSSAKNPALEDDPNNSKPPGAGHKDGSGHTQGRDEPYDEEPEST